MIKKSINKNKPSQILWKTLCIPLVLVFALSLSSCSSRVNYSVDKEHEDKIKVIYNMAKGLVENDSELYLSVFEQTYIENVKKVVDTLGTQYYDAENFDDLINGFFFQNKASLEANYGKKFNVSLSIESVEELKKEDLESFFDDYSVGYKIPFDSLKEIVNVSVKFYISGDKYNGNTKYSFKLLKLEDNSWVLHPESFLFSF